MTDLILNLLKEPSVQSDQNLHKILGEWAEELMNQVSQDLTVQKQEIFKWAQKLVSDQQVRTFVAKKLQEIYSGNAAFPTATLNSSASPTSATFSTTTSPLSSTSNPISDSPSLPPSSTAALNRITTNETPSMPFYELGRKSL